MKKKWIKLIKWVLITIGIITLLKFLGIFDITQFFTQINVGERIVEIAGSGGSSG